MIPKGFILLSRMIMESEFWNKPPYYLKLWVYLLLEANHKPKLTGQRLARGQLLTTLQKLCDAAAYKKGCCLITPTKDQVWGALRWMRGARDRVTKHDTKLAMITTTKTTRGLVITICNYGYYQNAKNYEHDGEGGTKPPRIHDTIDKNVKNGKGGAASPPASETPAPAPESTKAAAGRIVKLWIDRHAERVGCPPPKNANGKLAGILKNMLSGFSEADLAASVARWFATDRKDFGVELFKVKLEGGDAELTGRGSESYDGDDELGRRNLAKLRSQAAADDRNRGEA